MITKFSYTDILIQNDKFDLGQMKLIIKPSKVKVLACEKSYESYDKMNPYNY